jgi:hypothetical protein
VRPELGPAGFRFGQLCLRGLQLLSQRLHAKETVLHSR